VPQKAKLEPQLPAKLSSDAMAAAIESAARDEKENNGVSKPRKSGRVK
jgi:hypothetical protein